MALQPAPSTLVMRWHSISPTILIPTKMNCPTISCSATDTGLMKSNSLKRFLSFVFLSLPAFTGFAQNVKDLPVQENPPRLVNDRAHMMRPEQQQELEALLLNFDRTTSTQIAVVTVTSLDGHEVSDYAISLFNAWKIGQKGKNNGVLILASAEDRKMSIINGQGVEGALTDAQSGRIIRNEMAPEFRGGNYYEGFRKAAEAVIAATKGEYKNDEPKGRGRGGSSLPLLIIVGIIAVIVFAAIKGGGGKGGGGSYMRSSGSDFITGALLG
ncbi:MAG: TPM domain-containing protein, partial [Sphingobacteriales bacterium]